MSSADWLTLLAIVLGPILAVQAAQSLNRRRASKERKLHIFRTLMSTRGANLAPAHVDALNLIDIEFHGRSRKDKRVVEAWKMYLDHLNDRDYPRESWGARRVELFIVLLHRMAIRLGYDFDQSHLKNTSYFPEGYGTTMAEQDAIRKAALEVLSGRTALPMYLVNVPPAGGAAAPPSDGPGVPEADQTEAAEPRGANEDT